MYSLYLGFNYPAAIKPTAYVSVEQQYTTEEYSCILYLI